MSWLLCDYGQVLSLPQPPADRAALVEASGLAEDEFWHGYWANRAAYDRGEMTGTAYWMAVLGASPEHELVQRLNALDTASWLHPNPEALRAAGHAADLGYRLAILSNAPFDLANALDHVPWLAPFGTRFFSCRLGMSKPNPAIYRAVLAHLDTPSESVVFFDDRVDNVEAAAALGIEAHLFTSPEQIDRLPVPATPGRFP